MKRSLQRIISSLFICLNVLFFFPIEKVFAIECPAGTVSTDGVTCTQRDTVDVIRGQSDPAAGGSTAPGSQTGSPNQVPKPATGLHLQIGKNPACLAQGNCSLDDIVYTGTSAAQVLTVLSGALFLVAFIYGGFMYLISAGDDKKVSTGKTAMKTAALGMIIVMGAYVLIESVVTAIVSGK